MKVTRNVWFIQGEEGGGCTVKYTSNKLKAGSFAKISLFVTDFSRLFKMKETLGQKNKGENLVLNLPHRHPTSLHVMI